MTKYISLGLNIVLVIAVGILFYLHFADNQGFNSEGKTESSVKNDLKVAYINSDSLLNNYEYFKEMENQLQEKRKKLEAEFQNRAQGLQNEINNFQQSAGNMTISQARAVEEDLLKKQQNLRQYQDQLTQQLLEQEAEINEKLYNRVSEYLRDYGTRNNLELVLTYQKGSGVLYADDSLNITSEVVNGLNKLYQEGDNTNTVASDTTKTE